MPLEPRRDPGPAPRLAPGLRVVRRGRDRVQVGLAHPVVLPRSEHTRTVLHDLQAGQRPAADPRTEGLLALLRERGCLAGTPPAPPLVAVRRPERRLPVDLETLLSGSGMRATRWEHEAAAVLVLSVGEPAREPLDPLVRDGVPHLLVALLDGGARVGPLVVPGQTACLRCVDAHLAEEDPEHLAVLTRYVEASARPRGDGTDDLAGGAGLVALATGWALRDLGAYLRSATPATWSSTLTWRAEAPAPVTRHWRRRPGCGCGWALSGTMET